MEIIVDGVEFIYHKGKGTVQDEVRLRKTFIEVRTSIDRRNT